MQDVQFEVTDSEQLEEIRRFLIEHDLVEVPPPMYDVIGVLWPEVLHKVIPPRERMH
jgi:hypothetical protein